MTTALLIIAYLAFGGGVTTYISDDNPVAVDRNWSRTKRHFVACALFLTWPIWILFLVGAKVAEVLQ